MKKHKTLLLDIDGVLLNKEEDTNPLVWDLIDQLILKGINVSLLTARSFGLSSHLSKKINGIHIFDNGAVIKKGSKKLHQKTLKPEVTKKALSVIGEDIPSVRLGISTIDTFYANEKYFEHLMGYMPSRDIKKMASFEENKDLASSIWIRDLSEEKTKRLKENLLNFDCVFFADKNNEGSYSFFIHPKFTNKADSIDELSKITNIDCKEMVFIGDSKADIDSLKKVGLAVTVANAPKEVSECCHLITQEEYSLGLIEAIKNIWLE